MRAIEQSGSAVIKKIEREVRQACRYHADVPGKFTLLMRFGVLLMVYGAIMGSFGLWTGGQPLENGVVQVLYSAIKVPLLIGLTFVLGLPSLFVFYTLAGLTDDFYRVLSILFSTQMVFGLVLISFAPFTLLFYASSGAYISGILFNGVVFGLALLVWQGTLRKWFRELVASNSRHRLILWIWFLLYTFTGVQMGWVLRPFIGNPGSETTFFREDGWGNAWMELWEIMLAGLLSMIG